MEKLISIIPSQENIQGLIGNLPNLISQFTQMKTLNNTAEQAVKEVRNTAHELRNKPTEIKVIELPKKEIIEIVEITEEVKEELPVVDLEPVQEIVQIEENIVDVKEEDLEVVKIEKPKSKAKKKSKKIKTDE